MTDPVVRPMVEADLPAVERLTAATYHELDTRTFARDWPDPRPRPPERAAAWLTRTGHFLATDPGGCWVAEDDAGLAGVAVSYRRDGLWVLATFAVRPDAQGLGLGKALLAAALDHGRGCLRGMLSAGMDPRAVRRYRLAGFDLHPQMFLVGEVDRTALPVGQGKVRDGRPVDAELLDSLDRRLRGAARPADHLVMQRLWRLLVTDTTTGAGYAYVDEAGVPQLLAADNRVTASRLLWDALAATTGRTEVHHVTAANVWAVDVGLAAGLQVHQAGFLCLRGMKPPTPYLHNGVFL